MVSSTTTKLILAFISVILGAVLIGTIATNSQATTTKTNVANEAVSFTPINNTLVNISEVLTVTYPPTGWKITDCPLTSISVKNASGGTALTETTDYVFTASTGTFTLKDTAAVDAMIGDNVTYVDYTYCGDDYLNSAFGRSANNLIPGFFALALLGIGIGLFYSVGKDTGIVGK